MISITKSSLLGIWAAVLHDFGVITLVDGSFFAPVLFGVFASLAVSIVILKTKSRHLHLTAKGHAGLEIQSAHLHPTPRIGGIALILGIIVATLSTPSPSGLIGLVMLAGIPVFLAGLAEDIGLSASPKLRLTAAAISAAIAIYLTGATINGGVLPGLDILLAYSVFGAILTVFSVAATCHAFNLVDGMNGLAGTISLAATMALGMIAHIVGDVQLVVMSAATFAATLGVLAFNYPFGKLFLGDAGAYSLGFLIAWIGVLLIYRYPEVSVWAILLTIFLPFMDTTAAILRRVKKRVPVGEPDKLHYHHMVKRVIDRCLPGNLAQVWSNPLTTFLMLPVIVAAPLWAVMSYKSDLGSLLGLFFCTGLYFGTRRKLFAEFRGVVRKVRGDQTKGAETFAGSPPHSMAGE